MEGTSGQDEIGKGTNSNGDDPKPPRIDFFYIIREIGEVISFKKGFFYTIKGLIIRPGESVRSFLLEDRNRLVKPILFLIFCSFTYSVIEYFLGVEEAYYDELFENAGVEKTSLTVSEWLRANYGYANILMGLFIALCLKLVFYKKDFHYFELLVLLFYLMGVGMIFYGILIIIESISGWSLFMLGGLIVMIYTIWGVGQFYSGKPWVKYGKTTLAYLLGWALFSIFMLGVEMVIHLFSGK